MKEKYNILITGGAGFIGANLTRHFLQDKRIGLVRVVDDLSNGSKRNIEDLLDLANFQFLEGDISDYDVCLAACKGINVISHQAALGSVPRSIDNPMRSTEVNILGTVNLMHAAVKSGVKRIIHACSSSTYGDHPALPKVEDVIGKPLSPYAVTKLSIEHFADVFERTYGLEWVGLRYFNVFGPYQSPTNPYAAVIPIFVKAILNGEEVVINGDGETSRDFTYIDNVVHMNELVTFCSDRNALNSVYNVACSQRTTLNDLVSMVQSLTGQTATIRHQEERRGDVKHSLASIKKAQDLLNYQVQVDFQEGLRRTIQWISHCHD